MIMWHYFVGRVERSETRQMPYGECLKTNAPNQRYECHLGIPRMAFAMIHTVDLENPGSDRGRD